MTFNCSALYHLSNFVHGRTMLLTEALVEILTNHAQGVGIELSLAAENQKIEIPWPNQ